MAPLWQKSASLLSSFVLKECAGGLRPYVFPVGKCPSLQPRLWRRCLSGRAGCASHPWGLWPHCSGPSCTSTPYKVSPRGRSLRKETRKAHIPDTHVSDGALDPILGLVTDAGLGPLPPELHTLGYVLNSYFLLFRVSRELLIPYCRSEQLNRCCVVYQNQLHFFLPAERFL